MEGNQIVWKRLDQPSKELDLFALLSEAARESSRQFLDALVRAHIEDTYREALKNLEGLS